MRQSQSQTVTAMIHGRSNSAHRSTTRFRKESFLIERNGRQRARTEGVALPGQVPARDGDGARLGWRKQRQVVEQRRQVLPLLGRLADAHSPLTQRQFVARRNVAVVKAVADYRHGLRRDTEEIRAISAATVIGESLIMKENR